MTAHKMQEALKTILEELMAARDDIDDPLCDCAAEFADVVGVATYEAAGVLTHDKGLLVEVQDGSVFQLTIVKAC